MKKYILWFFVILVLASAGYGIKEYMRTRPDSKTLEAKYDVTASDILKEFTENEAAASKKYGGPNMVLTIKGTVKTVSKDSTNLTIFMGDPTKMDAIICTMDKNYRKEIEYLDLGDVIYIKGTFNGFDRDETGMIGSDIKLNYCVFLKREGEQ